MRTLHFLQSWENSYSSIIKGDQILEKRTAKALSLLMNDPFYPSLKSHKVNTRNFGEKWSSFVAGDLRIIWDFDEEEQQIILLFAIIKHSGSHRGYK